VVPHSPIEWRAIEIDDDRPEGRSLASVRERAYRWSMPAQRFPMRLGRRSLLFLRLFGVRGVENAYAEIDGDDIVARFGWAHLRFPIANIERWRIEGPWLWVTAIGIRMSVRHADLSFAGSPRGGVRMDFKERVKAGPRGLPALYVGVEDLEGFAAALTARGVPGFDARTDKALASSV
jgi:hypothetical protein